MGYAARVFVRRPFIALALLACVALPVGCSKDRVEECNALIDAINKSQSQVHKTTLKTQGKPPTPESLEELATSLDTLVAKIRQLEIEDAELRAFRDRYATTCEQLGDAVRKLSLTIDDQALINKANRELNDYRPKERALTVEINRFCTAGTPAEKPSGEAERSSPAE